MSPLKAASSAVWQGRRRATLLSYSLAGLIGILAGLAVVILSDLSLAWAAAVCLLSMGAAVMLVIGQVRRPLLALLAFTIPFHVGIHFQNYPTYHEGGPSAFTITPADTILAVLFLLWLGEAVFGRRSRIRLFPLVSVPAILLIALGMVSSLNAGDPLLSAYQVFELAKGLVFLLLVGNTVRDEPDLKWVLTGLMAAVVFQSSLSIYQALAGKPLGLSFLGETDWSVRQIIGDQLWIRPIGTFWSTNQLAMFLGMALPVVGALLIVRTGPGMKAGAAVTLFLGVLAAGFTLSRGAWIGLVLSVILLLAFGLRRRSIAVSHVLLGLVGLSMLLLTMNALSDGTVILRLTEDDRGSFAGRIPLMRGALTVVIDYPLFGSGLNNYQDTIRRYDSTGAYTETGYLPVVHNLFLLLAAEIGLLGVIVFLWLLAVLAWRGFRFSFRDKGKSILAATVVAGLLASELHMVVQNSVHVGLAGDTQLYIQFWFLAGLLLALTDRRGGGW